MARTVCERKGGEHENDGRTGRELAHEGAPSAGTEYRLAAAGTEGCAHFRSLAGLEKNDGNHGNADQYVKKDKKNIHERFHLQIIRKLFLYHNSRRFQRK